MNHILDFLLYFSYVNFLYKMRNLISCKSSLTCLFKKEEAINLDCLKIIRIKKMLAIFLLLFPNLSLQCSINSCNNKSICLIMYFNKFEELNLKCSISKHSRLYFIKPNYPLILSNNLNLNDLHLSGKAGDYSKLVFNNLNGFELNSSPFHSIKSNGLEIYNQFMNTKFQFYFNNSLIQSLDVEPILFRGLSQSICFSNDVTYFKNTSIIIFKNSYIKLLKLFYLENSYISHNYLTFNQSESIENLNSHINQLDILVYNLRLKDDLLNKYVFKHLKVLQIKSTLVGIQPDLFDSFKEIRVIVLNLRDLNRFIHRGLKWLNYLNKNVNVNLRQKNVKINANDIIYILFNDLDKSLFKSEDFCFYYDFPFNRLIFPIVFNLDLQSCSFIWIQQYYKLYEIPEVGYKFFSPNIRGLKSYLKKINFDSYYRSCNFKKKIDNCLNVSNNDQNYKYDYNDDSIIRLTKFINFILSIILLPIVCISGIFFNSLILITLSNSKFKKDFKLQMFRSIHLNSIFIIIECFLFLFQLITKCIEPNGIYCSPFRKYLVVQYFHMIFINYLGSVFKLCSNFTSVSIAFNRFMTISENKNKLLSKIYNLKVGYLSLIIIFTSLLLNSFKLLKYDIDYKDYYYTSFYVYIDLVYPFYNPNYYRTKFGYLYLEMVYYFTDNIFCLILILLFDIKLIMSIRQNMINKSKISCVKNTKNSIEVRTSIMVALNCLLILVSHCLEFIFTLMTILSGLFKRDFFDPSFLKCFDLSDYLCGYFRNDLALFFYFMSYSFYFFLYYYFNSKFKLSFGNLFLGTKIDNTNNSVIDRIIIQNSS